MSTHLELRRCQTPGTGNWAGLRLLMPIREIIAPVSVAQVFVPRYCVWAKDRREGWGHSTYRSQSEHWSGRDGTAQESLAALILHFRIDIFLSF